uniref:Immunoglobulin V-set domain-containing protein n=1 Tax=Salarias fasciatus TaxID=181472 RepID=A0A672ISZ1_SALFA
ACARACAISALFSLAVLSIVEMKIVSVTGRVGSAVSFHCSGWDTQTDIASYDKYFCKDPCKSGKDVILTASFMKTDQTNKIQISNKGESLLVTFTDLQMSDSKTYYCGVDRFFRDNYIKVNLKVLQGKNLLKQTLLAPLCLLLSSTPPTCLQVTWVAQEVSLSLPLPFTLPQRDQKHKEQV